MKTNTLPLTWDEVIFENRNKAYGAFAMRQAHAGNTFKGALVSTMLVAAVLSSAYWRETSVPVHDGSNPFDNVLHLLPEPVFEIEQTQTQVRTIASPTTNTDLTPQVTSNPVTDESIISSDVSGPVTTTQESTTSGAPEGTVSTAPLSNVAEPVETSGPKIFAEQMPEYVGGTDAMRKFLQKKLKYPPQSRRLGIQGTVFVQFVITKNGVVSDVEVLRGISEDCDREAVRVISMMPPWQAARHNQTPVAVRMVLPVKFEMPDIQ